MASVRLQRYQLQGAFRLYGHRGPIVVQVLEREGTNVKLTDATHTAEAVLALVQPLGRSINYDDALRPNAIVRLNAYEVVTLDNGEKKLVNQNLEPVQVADRRCWLPARLIGDGASGGGLFIRLVLEGYRAVGHPKA